jgi:hypothetical protein
MATIEKKTTQLMEYNIDRRWKYKQEPNDMGSEEQSRAAWVCVFEKRRE